MEAIQTLFWPTVAVLATIAIYSFLFRDNAFYKMAEHIFIGLNVGYYIVVSFRNVVIPKISKPLQTAIADKDIGTILLVGSAVLVGLLYVSRFFPKYAWLSRYPISIVVGFGSGFAVIITMQTYIMQQLYGTVIDNTTGKPLFSFEKFGIFFKDPSFATFIDALNGPIFILGVVFVLLYFFFSLKNENPIVRWSNKPALLFLMLAFGAAFGYTFMGRISLFIGRMNYIFSDWWGLVQTTLGG